MYKKVKELVLIEIRDHTHLSSWAQHLVLSHPESPRGAPLRTGAAAEACSILCLLIRRVAFCIHKTTEDKFSHTDGRNQR